MLLLLSHFSRVQLCATPQTSAHQAPPSLGFSRQEHWSGLPFPSPMHGSKKWKWTRLVMSDSSRPHGLQPPGSSIHGIFQARVLEWGAIAFSVFPLHISTFPKSEFIPQYPSKVAREVFSLMTIHWYAWSQWKFPGYVKIWGSDTGQCLEK